MPGTADALELESHRLSDELGEIGYRAQWAARQGGHVWIATETMAVATDDDGGGTQVVADGVIWPELVTLVPEAQRRLVTLNDIERERRDFERRQRALQRELYVLDARDRRDAHERLRSSSAFAERHVTTARRAYAAAVSVVPRSSRSPRARPSRRTRLSRRARSPGSSDPPPEPEPPLARLRRLLARLLRGPR